MKQHHVAWPATLTLAALVTLGMQAAPLSAASHVRAKLVATDKDPDARGRARLTVRRSDGRLNVAVRRLRGGATFEVIVDGVRIGRLVTGVTGSGKARFSTRPRGHDQLLGLDPRSRRMELRDDEGDDVLETEMGDAEPQPGTIRCCISDDDDSSGEHETECEYETAEECAAHGGTSMGEGSCMPNPCETIPPQDEIRCCFPDPEEGGPDCDHETPAACALEGGINIGPGECGENACVPPPADAIRCCVPDHDSAGDGLHDDSESSDDEDASSDEAPECEQVTAAACAELGGTDLGPGSCDAALCMGSPDGAFLEASAVLP